MLRRILAITLLIAFGFPPAAPLFAAAVSTFTADPEANLPPCCRSHGAHHCAMMHRMMLAASRNPALQATPCPFYPNPSAVPVTTPASLAAPLFLNAQSVRTLAPLPTTPRRAARIFLASANLKRGPPAVR